MAISSLFHKPLEFYIPAGGKSQIIIRSEFTRILVHFNEICSPVVKHQVQVESSTLDEQFSF